MICEAAGASALGVFNFSQLFQIVDVTYGAVVASMYLHIVDYGPLR